MVANSTQLLTPLHDDNLLLTPLEETHRDDLRMVCAEDSDIWRIYAKISARLISIATSRRC
jgi:hypothetical protein